MLNKKKSEKENNQDFDGKNRWAKLWRDWLDWMRFKIAWFMKLHSPWNCISDFNWKAEINVWFQYVQSFRPHRIEMNEWMVWISNQFQYSPHYDWINRRTFAYCDVFVYKCLLFLCIKVLILPSCVSIFCEKIHT